MRLCVILILVGAQRHSGTATTWVGNCNDLEEAITRAASESQGIRRGRKSLEGRPSPEPGVLGSKSLLLFSSSCSSVSLCQEDVP